MATWPAKTNYATGDVLTAAQMNDIGGELNDLYTTAGTAAGKNAVINGGFDIWQRGTSISLAASTAYTSGYSADRWCGATNANQAVTISRQATGDTTNLPNIQYAMRYQRNSGQTGTGTLYISQSIETINTIPFVGKTVTLSFYARAGANYSPTSSLFNAAIQTGTGTDQNANAYTGTSTLGTTAFTLTTTWQRFSLTVAIPTTVTEFAPLFWWTPTGTAGANDYFEITGVQLELGSSATPFSRNGSSIQGELAACQRYYERLTADTAYGAFATALATSTTIAAGLTPFKVTKRVTPTAIDTSAVGGFQLDDGANAYTASALVISSAYNSTQWGAVTITTSGMTQYRPCFLVAKNSSTAYIGFSAEL